VPSTNAEAIYGESGVVEIGTLSVTAFGGGSISSIADRALHSVAYFGDVSGNARVNGSDSALVARVGALLDVGFGAALRTDPVLLGDISGNGRINASDASKVAQFAALIPVAEIPAIPAGGLAAGFGIARADSPPVAQAPPDSTAAAIQEIPVFSAPLYLHGRQSNELLTEISPPESDQTTLSDHLDAVDALMAATVID
jgi:hypothetical protein